MWEFSAATFRPLAVRGLMALAIFAGFWLAGVLLPNLIVRVGDARRFDRYLVRLFGRTVKLTLLIVGAITALGTVGFDVTALVAGVGLTGFALGFALKDIVSNVLSGIMLIIYKPFRHGDHIKVSAFEGAVSDVDLRYTTLEAAEGTKIYVPNSFMFTNAITVERLTTASGGPIAAAPELPGNP